jgi:pimeloyl-ACP methyl ester carboxylesterase
MHWQESGQGLPVILVHGLLTSPSVWRHVIPRIKGGQCLAWELIGYGSSIPQGCQRDISVARQAVYVRQWLAAVGIKRAVLVGHDLGGGIVQIVAAQQPEVCAGLVLINSVGYDAWPAPTVKATRRFSALVERLPPRLFRLAFTRFMRLAHTSRDQAAEAFAIHWPHYAVYGPRVFVRQARGLDLRDMRNVIAALQRLDVPIRIVWGAKDPFLPVHYGFRFARDLNAAFQYIFKGRHFTPEDQPAIVAATVNDVLTQLRGEESSQHLQKQCRYG